MRARLFPRSGFEMPDTGGHRVHGSQVGGPVRLFSLILLEVTLVSGRSIVFLKGSCHAGHGHARLTAQLLRRLRQEDHKFSPRLGNLTI